MTTANRKAHRKPSLLYLALVVLTGFAFVVCLLFVFYQPDRPVATIVPASSSGPAFVAQVVRPRLGLPLGGLLPPQLFGVDGHLGFDSSSDGAQIRSVGPERIELCADNWDLVLAVDGDGQFTTQTRIVFDLVFQGRLRRVRCRPGNPAVGVLKTATLEAGSQLSGSFNIELAHCEDAETGRPLGWPPKPLILHGSFDRLPLEGDTN